MNRLDRIDQLRNAGIEDSYLLDQMTQWFGDNDIKSFYYNFVREHDITFGEEEEEEEPMGLAELIAHVLEKGEL